MMGAMELRHLRYFVAVAEELNFTHAAARLRVAQPALSSQIRDLEEELEAILFERGRRGVQLTRAGKAFYVRSRNILAQAADAANEARTAAGAITGTLVVGFPSGLHLNYLAPLLTAFKSARPKVAFDYVHALVAPQLKALREGRIDVGFVTLPASLDGLASRVIWAKELRTCSRVAFCSVVTLASAPVDLIALSISLPTMLKRMTYSGSPPRPVMVR